MGLADVCGVLMVMTCGVVMVVMSTSPPVTAPPEPPVGLMGDEPPAVEAPAGNEEEATMKKREEEKRSGSECYVAGYVYRHGEVFSYPGYSHCIKYRCNNGGYSVVQEACERNSQCIPVGSSFNENCRSLSCIKESRGDMNIYRLAPNGQDQCSLDLENGGHRCVQKGVPFVHSNCHKYQCLATPNGGYQFHVVSAQCKDDYGNCVAVNQRFTKYVNGHRYNNCICLHGGGYSCRG